MVLPFLVPVAAQIASEFLPSLVGKLGGDNAEAVAESVVDVAATAAGVPESKDLGEILERLRADAQAQADLKIRLAEIENREEERLLEDRLSARMRSLEVEKGGRRNYRADLMLLLSFGGLIACIAAAVWPYPAGRALGTPEIGLLTTVAGVLLKMLSDAFAFEFGSSQGSKSKDTLIARFQDQLQELARQRADDPKRESRTARAAARAAKDAVAEAGRPADPAAPDAATIEEIGLAARLRRGAL
ncbi:MAG: hypothetical protein GVY33_00445 [Alphaproteobacteria bacterium]|jgi:hypothetical protein|nr:hypothetical protein [Alphaproteobacteria bacterium]